MVDRAVTFTLDDGSGTAGGGSDTASFIANVTLTDNHAPVANDDNFTVNASYGAIASSLTWNDSDADDADHAHPGFAISGAAHLGDSASFDEATGAWTIQGTYGTLRLFPEEQASVTVGGFTDIHLNAGDFIFTVGKDILDQPLAYDELHDLPAGQQLTDVFTYTITDGHGASATTTVTFTFDPSPVHLTVRTPGGYDMTTLAEDIQLGDVVSIDEDGVVLTHDGRTITVDAKNSAFEAILDGFDLTGGLIKGFHVQDFEWRLVRCDRLQHSRRRRVQRRRPRQPGRGCRRSSGLCHGHLRRQRSGRAHRRHPGG